MICSVKYFTHPVHFYVKKVFGVRKECALLNRGACGEVKVAFSKGNCERFAVKMISKKKFTIGGVNQIVSRKNGGQFAKCGTSTGTFFLKLLDLVIFFLRAILCNLCWFRILYGSKLHKMFNLKDMLECICIIQAQLQ